MDALTCACNIWTRDSATHRRWVYNLKDTRGPTGFKHSMSNIGTGCATQLLWQRLSACQAQQETPLPGTQVPIRLTSPPPACYARATYPVHFMPVTPDNIEQLYMCTKRHSTLAHHAASIHSTQIRSSCTTTRFLCSCTIPAAAALDPQPPAPETLKPQPCHS